MKRLSLLVVLCAAVPAQAAKRVAVLPITTPHLPAEMLPSLTAVVSVELAKAAGLEVVSPRDIDSMLSFERLRDRVDCTDTSCYAEVGRALGVDRLLAANIGRLGRTYVLDLVLIDIRESRVVARSYDGSSGTPEELVRVIKAAVRDLAAQVALAEPQPQPPAIAVPPPVTTNLRKPWAWAAAGTGVATMIAGGVLRQNGRVPDGEADSAALSGKRRTGAAAIGIGAALTLGGLFALGVDSPPVTATLLPGGAAVMARLSF